MRFAKTLMCLVCFYGMAYAGIKDDEVGCEMLSSPVDLRSFVENWIQQKETPAHSTGHTNLSFEGSLEHLPKASTQNLLSTQSAFGEDEGFFIDRVHVRACFKPVDVPFVSPATSDEQPITTQLINTFVQEMLPYAGLGFMDRLLDKVHPLEALAQNMVMVRPASCVDTRPLNKGSSHLKFMPPQPNVALYHFLNDHPSALMPLREALTFLPDPKDRTKVAHSKRFKVLINGLNDLVTLPKIGSDQYRSHEEAMAYHVFRATLLIEDARVYNRLSSIKKFCHGDRLLRRTKTEEIVLAAGMRRLFISGLWSACRHGLSANQSNEASEALKIVGKAYGFETCVQPHVCGQISKNNIEHALEAAFGSPEVMEAGLEKSYMWRKHAAAYASRHNGDVRRALVGGESYAREALRRNGYFN